MNKTDKRQRSIRNKLMAAVAMLLVASIMTVTTTYAWFTLSTAPEVQGITTTVGANGNLEIALAHPTGMNELVGSDVGDTNQAWFVKNLTWGNLLNLADAAYGLANIALLPSRLNITAASATNPATLDGSPLSIPVYGADGRIGAMDKNSMMYGAKDPTGGSNFLVDPTVEYTYGSTTYNIEKYKGYGVRALGTSSTMSETQMNFQTALNAINSYRGQANGKASGAIYTYGDALADMAVMHAAATMSGTDGNDYSAFVPDLKGMIAELAAASELVESALINAMIAISNANIPYGAEGKTIGDATVTDGKTVREYLKDGEKLGMTVIWTNIPDAIKTKLNDDFPTLVESYNTWKSNETQISDTTTKLNALNTEGAVSWGEVSPALSGLMNTNYVTLNGMKLSELSKAELLKNVANLNLEMGDGSGVLANFGKLTGNLSATVELSEKAVYEGESLAGVEINLVTTSEPAAGPLLSQVRSTINTVGAATSSNETTSIDVTYGYVLDFLFRTNAANSNLLLQTEGVQRVYSDATNVATMGAGSTMTFSAKYSDLESLVSMMSGIRVVFTNTTGDETQVYGIAKTVFDDLSLPLTVNTATLGTVTDADSKHVSHIAEGAAASDLKVTLSTKELGNGNIQLILKTGDHTYIVVTEVEDNATAGKDYLWTAYTAMWYEKTTVTEILNADGTGTGQYETVKEEIELVNDKGLPLFYPVPVLDESTGYVAWTDATKATTLTAIDTANTKIDLTVKTSNATGATETVNDAVLANWVDPAYYYVHDKDNTSVEVKAPLYLHTYSVGTGLTEDGGNGIELGKLVFGEPMAVQTLTGLDQNVVKGVSALVYLDGDYVDNSDVVNSENGISNTGALNLQFASSANLVPMENAALKDGKTYTVDINRPAGEDDLTVLTTAEVASEGQAYNFGLLSNTYTVTYQVGEGEAKTLTGTQQSYAGQSGYVYTIPASEVKGNITITIAAPAAGG